MEMRLLTSASITEAELEAAAALVNLLDPSARFGPPFPPNYVRRHLELESSFHRRVTWGAWADGTLVAIAQVDGAVKGENQDVAEVVFGVHPDHRRRGHGRALVEHLRTEARRDQRPTMHAWLELTETVRAFFDRIGFEEAFDERISRIDLSQVDADLMRSWVDRAADRAAGYHLERWVDHCPDHLLDAYVEASAGMNDAPLEGLAFEKPRYSHDRVRDRERYHRHAGRLDHVVLAVETATGRGAGYTSVHVLEDRPSHSEQGDTTTLADHRNRGLGRWLKASMWQWLRDERPEVQYLETGNADSNEAMLAINVAMGYEPAYHFGGWQHLAGSADDSDPGEG